MMQNGRGRDCFSLNDERILALAIHWYDFVPLKSHPGLLGEGQALLGQVGTKRLIAHLLHEKQDK